MFDTNIYISAFLIKNSKGEEAILKVINEDFELLISKEIVYEIIRVLSRKFSKNKKELNKIVHFLSGISIIIQTKSKINVLKDDSDNRILECAIDGKAKYIVTGDKELLSLKRFKGIKIISLKEFLENI